MLQYLQKYIIPLIGTLISRRMSTLPYRIFFRRNKLLWVVIGRDDGVFLDNSKYFYCWLKENAPFDVQVVYVTRDKKTQRLLKKNKQDVYLFPTWRAKLCLLKAGFIIVDNYHSFEGRLIDWYRGAILVQLWHGSPLKEIELMLHKKRLQRLGEKKRKLALLILQLEDKFPRLDFLISPSQFFSDHVFIPAFNAKSIILSGYPRNDIFSKKFNLSSALVKINTDSEALERIERHKHLGGKVIIYMPTYRDDFKSSFDIDGFQIDAWNETFHNHNHNHNHNILLVLKLHPEMGAQKINHSSDKLIFIDADSDIYPILPQTDILITDYSSIYFDYLHNNKPIIFFPYDLDYYLINNRNLIFEYGDILPGPVVKSFDELILTIQSTLAGIDGEKWEEMRKEIKNLAFQDDAGNASKKIFESLKNLCMR